METTLIKRNELADQETGLVVKGSLIANSGFNYLTGIRQFNNLKIVEGVSKGTASIFLTSLMVFDENGSLIFDGEIRKMTSYSRETARKMVLEGLMIMLREATEKDHKYFDELAAYELIDQQLKSAYYEQSYEAVIKWAIGIGINIF